MAHETVCDDVFEPSVKTFSVVVIPNISNKYCFFFKKMGVHLYTHAPILDPPPADGARTACRSSLRSIDVVEIYIATPHTTTEKVFTDGSKTSSQTVS